MEIDPRWDDARRIEAWAGEVRVNLIRLAAVLVFYAHHLVNVYIFHDDPDILGRFHTAVTALVVAWAGGVLALLVTLTRWPAVHLLPADWFYLVLTAHGLDMLVFWIIFFEIAVLYFAGSVLLRCRLATPLAARPCSQAPAAAAAVIESRAGVRGWLPF